MSKSKELRRNTETGMLAGVCAGLADYFDIDVVIVRVVTVILTLATNGVGLIVYIVMAVVMPTNDSSKSKTDMSDNIQAVAADIKTNLENSNLRNYAGLALILFGAILLLDQFALWTWVVWEYVWPLVLIFIGILVLSRR